MAHEIHKHLFPTNNDDSTVMNYHPAGVFDDALVLSEFSFACLLELHGVYGISKYFFLFYFFFVDSR
jgi:hypothetical protein